MVVKFISKIISNGGNKMDEFKRKIVSKIFDIEKRKLGVFAIILVVTFLILFPFIDTNFFYSNRIKNRIEVLDKITKLDVEKIEKNDSLRKEYNSILEEINNVDKNYVNKIFSSNKNSNALGKFISGGVLWWFLGILVLFFYNVFNKEQQTKGNQWLTRILGFIMCIVIGGIIGFICSLIPTMFNPWFNYLIMPIVVLILMILLLTKTNKNK